MGPLHRFRHSLAAQLSRFSILKSTNMKNPLFSFFSNIVYETGLTSRFDGTRRNR